MVEKQGQKIRAEVSPPPFRAMPERKHFFFVRASLSLGSACVRIGFSIGLVMQLES